MTHLVAKSLVRTIRQHCPDVSPHPLPPPLSNVYRPGVSLNNVAFENGVHRKLHVEYARIGVIDVAHAVMYPRPLFDAPILAMDLVSVGNKGSFCILDACPVTDDLSLPADYSDALNDIQRRYGMVPASRVGVPEWGAAIFSTQCVLRRQGVDVDAFLAYATACLIMHLEYCTTLRPSRDQARIRRNHARFCRMQLQNERTRSTLASALGGDVRMANEYMTKVMFDV